MSEATFQKLFEGIGYGIGILLFITIIYFIFSGIIKAFKK